MSSELPDFLDKFFNNLHESNVKYVLLRELDLSDLGNGSDIDLYVDDVTEFLEITDAIFSQCFKNLSNYKLKISNYIKKQKYHVDLLADDRIILRFDLIYGFASYRLLAPKEIFIVKMFSKSFKCRVECDGFDFTYNRPSILHESLLRYYEYHNFFVDSPLKTKHISYIISNLGKDVIDETEFFSCLHRYSNFNFPFNLSTIELMFDKPKRTKIENLQELISSAYRFYNANGLYNTIKRILNYVR